MSKFLDALKKAGKWTLNTLDELSIPAISSVADMAIGVLGSSWQKNTVNDHMSGAEREAAEFNANEAQKARDFNMQMDNTKYQRQVVDMQNAGINPALAMNGGVSTQATSNAVGHASTSPSPIMSVADLATTAANLKNLKAQRDLTDAQARLADANAKAVTMENNYRDEWLQLRNEGQRRANNMTDAEIKFRYKQIDKAEEEIKLIIAQAKTEEERQNALAAEAWLKRANAQQVEALTDVLVKLHEAQTEAAKAQAGYYGAMELYQQGLIDSGYIENLAKKEGYNAEQAEQIALSLSADNAKRGLVDEMSNGEEFYDGKFAKFFGTTMWQIADLFGSVLHVGVNYQGNTTDSRSQSTSNSTVNSTTHSTSNSTVHSYSNSTSNSTVHSYNHK